MSGDVTLLSAGELSLSALTDLFNRAFEGYFVGFKMTPDVFGARLVREQTDLALSRIAVAGGEPAAVALLSVRGRSCRCAGMGTVASWRRRGVGRRLMKGVMPLLRDLGFERFLLEVIQQNEAAIALYRDAGLEITRPLLGYELAPGAGPMADDGGLVEVDVSVVARAVAAEGPPDLSWQLDAAALAGWGPPSVGYALRDGDGETKAWAVLHDPGAARPKLVSLVVQRSCRRQGWGRRMVGVLGHRHGRSGLDVPAVVPEEVADGFLRRLGFVRSPLLQYEMECRLSR